MQDPDAKKAGQLAKYAHGAAFPVLGMLFAPGETEEEKRDWVQKCLDELHSGKSPTGTQV
jgi:endo-beta-N-acetylglucosaminidase D